MEKNVFGKLIVYAPTTALLIFRNQTAEKNPKSDVIDTDLKSIMQKEKFKILKMQIRRLSGSLP